MTNREEREIARRVTRLERSLKGLAGGTHLAYSSIENGTLLVNDENQTPVMTIGLQDDGTTTIKHVKGPKPPVPTSPVVEVDYSTLVIRWDGAFEGGVPAPADWDRVEVHASTDPDVEWGGSTARENIVSVLGGEVTVRAEPGTQYVCLVAWSRAGEKSQPSTVVTVEVPSFAEVVDAEIKAAEDRIAEATKVYYDQNMAGRDAAIDKAQKDLATSMASLAELKDKTLPALSGDLSSAKTRLTTAEGKLNQAQKDLASTQSSLTTAEGTIAQHTSRLAALPGQITQARDDAISTALANTRSEIDKIVITDSGNATSYKSTPPSGNGSKIGDSWYQFNGSGALVGSWWWDGSAWKALPLDRTIIPLIDIGAGTFGSLSGQRLDVGSVAADRVLVGAGRNLIPWNQVLTESSVSPHTNEGYYGAGELSTAPADPAAGVPAHMVHNRTTSDPGVDRYILSFRSYPTNDNKRSMFAVSGGTWTLSVGAYSAVTGMKARLALVWYKADMSYGAAVTSAPVEVTGTPARLSVTITLPDSAAYMKPFVRTNQPGITHWVNPELSPAVGGTLIEPGGIQTPHLAADVMEVGNLKAGNAALDVGVARKFAAETGQFMSLDVKQLTATGTSKLNDVVAKQIAADSGKFISLDVGQLTAGTGALNTAVINKLFSDVVVAKTAVAGAFIGKNAIIDGSIDAKKITATKEMWTKILGANKIKAVNIDAEVFTGQHFAGATFTGSTFRTSATNPRVELNANGLHAWDSSGAETMTVGSNGAVTMIGDITTGMPGSFRTTVSNALWSNIALKDWDGQDVFASGAGVRIGKDTATDRYGDIIFAEISGSSGQVIDPETEDLEGTTTTTKPALVITGPGQTMTDRANLGLYGDGSVLLRSKDGAPITLRSQTNRGDYVRLAGDGSVKLRSTGGAGLSLTKEGQVILKPGLGGKDSARLYMYDSAIIQTRGGDSAILRTGNNRAAVEVGAGGGEISMRADNVRVTNGTLYYQRAPTTGQPANLHIDSNGWVAKSTSSRRYKHDIQDFTVPDALLDVPFRTWIDKGEYERNGANTEGLARIPGLIAEEVAEACPELVIYDDKGRPDALAGDRIGMAALTLIRRQRDRITDLEDRIANLEGAFS